MEKSLQTLALALFCSLSGTVFAQPDSSLVKSDDTLQDQSSRMPIFTSSIGDINAELESQDISGLLQASRDIFSSTAGYNFGNARFRVRGLGSDNTAVFINGFRVNDMETGWASWSNWGGLNDITRGMEVRTGLAGSSFGFTGINGYSAMNVRASEFRPGVRVSYANSNRSYAHRVMATGSTGFMANGVAVTASVSARYAEEGYIPGSSFQAFSYFLSVEKKINEKHSLGFVGFGAPNRQGRTGAATQEVYDLVGSNYYNPYWGMQNGEKRNSRMAHSHEPTFMINHYFSPNSRLKLNSGLMVSPGKSGLTMLNWYDAADPRPDYYKYLPSYYDPEYPDLIGQVTNAWQTDINTQQINFDQLYYANMGNMYQVLNANGTGETVVGNRSKYIIEDNRNDVFVAAANVLGSYQLKDNMSLSFGANYTLQNSHYYKVIEDFLGGDFWLDLNRFAENNGVDDNASQANLETVNNVISDKNEIFGYDYYLNYRRFDVFAQQEFKSSRVDGYVAVNFSHSSFWRDGIFQNGMFPEDSKGESEHFAFNNGGIKAGAVFKITGRHFIQANAAFLTRAPLARNVFPSPRSRNLTVDNVQNEKILGGDLSYIIRYPKFKLRVTGYYNQINDQTWLRNFYHDALNNMVNYSMTNVDQEFAGIEFGAEGNVYGGLTVSGVLALGQYVYTDRPLATITVDNSAEILAQDRVVYLKNYRVGGTPQTAASVGLKYNGKKFWFAGVNFNYFDEIWLEPNPDRRTAEAVANFVEEDPQWNDNLDQEKLDAGYTVDLYGGKSWKIKKYFINASLNVSNLLNNQSFRIGGFEQLRYESNDISKFPPKYYYHLGTTYYVMVSFRF